MSEAAGKVAKFLDDLSTGAIRDEFMLYEPWDVEERGADMYAIAEKYHVDLRGEEFTAVYGSDPHLFQTGYMFDLALISSIFGGNQVGKSYCAMMDMLIVMTGEKPYSLRYPKGHDTGILREKSEQNIKRFGRFDNVTNEFIDKNALAKDDGTWNCGNIIGVGVYPDEKIAPKNQKAWLGTFSQSKDEYWWPRLKKFLPAYLIDSSRGRDGFAEKAGIVYLSNGNEIHCITYEQGYAKFEAENVWMIVLDEEPPDERIFTSALQHISQGGIGVRLIETPYRGLTWTYEKIVKKAPKSKDVNIHHATQYDSPYQSNKMIESKIKLMKPWEIESRVFGVHSEQKGRPYYDRERINRWIRLHSPTHTLWEFYGMRRWETVREAMTTPIAQKQVFDKEDRDEWEVYEKPDDKTAYWMSVDTGMGATEAEDAADRNSAKIFRAPKGESEKLGLPIMVAACRSTQTTINFARNCLYAARTYNNCLIAPESKGETASTFISEIRDYPFLFTMTVINDKTRKPTQHIGFDTNARTRRIIFDLIGDFLNEVDALHYPFIPHYYTLVELAALVVAKRGRPDHPNGGTSDCAISFGIGLYVWMHAKEQIRNNYGYSSFIEKDDDCIDKWGTRINKSNEKRPILGSKRGLDERQRTRRVR